MQKTLKLLVVLPVLAILPFGFAAACGRSFLYYPTRISEVSLQALAARPGWRLDPLRVEPEVVLNGLVRPPSAVERPWLVFYGGNAMGLEAGQSILELLAGDADWGLAVWAYRGYDGSGGRPTETGLCSDATTQIDHLASTYGVSPSQLVVMGQSLGSGVAAHTAAVLTRRGEAAAGLVLLSPYTSIAQVANDAFPLLPVGWAMPDTYRTDRLLDDLRAPILLIHGTEDTLIRIEHGETLAELLGERAVLHRVAGAGHNDLWNDGPAVLRIRALVNEATSSD